LFTNFASDRDVLGNPGAATISTLLLHQRAETLAMEPGAYSGTNTVRFDDFYLTKNGFSRAIPRLFDIRGVTRNGSSATITWDSRAPLSPYGTAQTFTVQRKHNINDVSWTTLTTGLPTGGNTTTFVDPAALPDNAYYRITCP